MVTSVSTKVEVRGSNPLNPSISVALCHQLPNHDKLD